MTPDAIYVLTSLVWAAYGLALGMAAGYLVRLVWMALTRK